MGLMEQIQTGKTPSAIDAVRARTNDEIITLAGELALP